MLKRSKTAPLDIVTTIFPRNRELIASALNNFSRIRNIHICEKEGFELQWLVGHFVEPAPVLESLILTHSLDHRYVLPGRLFSGVAPRLRRLEFRGGVYYMSSHSPFLHKLTSLTISGVKQSLISVDQFMTLLRNMPYLETLDLGDILPNRHPDLSYFDHFPEWASSTLLPNLIRIKLECDLRVSVFVLERLVYPVTTSVILITSIGGWDEDFSVYVPSIIGLGQKRWSTSSSYSTLGC